MGGPKGNKHALGNNGGRPRKYDLAEEAKALVEWANKKDSLVLRLFAAIRGYDCQSRLNDYCNESEEFRQSYNQAKIIIGARREELLMKGRGNPAPFNRYAALYDVDLKKHEKELKEDDAKANAMMQPLFVTYPYQSKINDSSNTDPA